MKHFSTITEYCRAIGISPPRHPHFDIRKFEDNMSSVMTNSPPFRHEFYSIALKLSGNGKVITGHHHEFSQGTIVFFNSPFQLLSWDIISNWSGYYILISQDFLTSSPLFSHLLDDFSFLKINESIPFQIKTKDIPCILSVYENIFNEYHSNHWDKFKLIETYVLLLLHQVRRLFQQQIDPQKAQEKIRNANFKLLSNFQQIIKISFYPDTPLETFANLHSPSYYARKISIHPNHLNAVVKNITGHTALYHIHHHILKLAKAELMQTTKSVKEIAYLLYFESPNNFSVFFNKKTGLTPLQFRRRKEI
jgi:AraC-like DNA-binding protein